MTGGADPGGSLRPWRRGAPEPLPGYSSDARVAVFIDFENLVCGAGKGSPEQSGPVPAKALELLCRGFYGNAAIRRAYADWANPGFGRHQGALADNGVDLIQVTRAGTAGKNAADIRMAVDAMEALITHPEIAVFLLVSGDSDYSPLVQRLREFGKHVVGVGTRANAGRRLVSVCSEYKFWGTIVAAVEPATRPAVAAAFDIADAEELLVRAFEQIPTDSATAGTVKSKMLALDPSFDQANYGCVTFRDLLTRLAHRVTTVGRSGHDIVIALTAPASP